jgi:hypothetical protein
MLVAVVVAIVFVVLISPVAFGVPALRIGVPPPMAIAPAMFAGFGEVVTGAVGLGTAIAVMLDSLVKAVIGAVNASLAVVIGTQGGGCAEGGKGREGCCQERGFAEVVYPSKWQVHCFSSLLVRTSLEMERRVAS